MEIRIGPHRKGGIKYCPFAKINAELLGASCRAETATLDMDATITQTTKESALYSYKGVKAYQPLNTY